jgi:hypothetical protein
MRHGDHPGVGLRLLEKQEYHRRQNRHEIREETL